MCVCVAVVCLIQTLGPPSSRLVRASGKISASMQPTTGSPCRLVSPVTKLDLLSPTKNRPAAGCRCPSADLYPYVPKCSSKWVHKCLPILYALGWCVGSTYYPYALLVASSLRRPAPRPGPGSTLGARRIGQRERWTSVSELTQAVVVVVVLSDMVPAYHASRARGKPAVASRQPDRVLALNRAY